MRVTLVQCTKTKRDEAAPAQELYDVSDYFCDMRGYAKAQDCPWYILSAKHGLVHPETAVEPYDERGLSETQAAEIATKLAKQNVSTVEVVAGSDYSDPLVPELEKEGIEVINNLRGCKIGTRQNRLQEWRDALIHDNLC